MKDSRKILIVSSEFPPQPGGIGNHAFHLATQLYGKGEDVSVLTNSRNSTKLSEEIVFEAQQGFKVQRIKRNSLSVKTYIGRLRSLKKLIKNMKPSVILFSGKFPLWMSLFVSSSKLIHKIAVIHGSEVNLPNSWQRFLVHQALKGMNKIIAVSNYTKDLIPIVKSKTVVIPNGIASEGFKKDTIKKRRDSHFLNLITVGALTERKGQQHVINALPKLVKVYPSIHYHMVGIPKNKEALTQLASELGVLDHITIHGVLNNKELHALWVNNDIFVMLSTQTNDGTVEGFGIALIEANTFGIPTIGALGCGIEDAIDHGVSGMLVKNDDAQQFKDAVRTILGNSEQFEKGALKWADKHRWEELVERYLEHFDSAQ